MSTPNSDLQEPHGLASSKCSVDHETPLSRTMSCAARSRPRWYGADATPVPGRQNRKGLGQLCSARSKAEVVLSSSAQPLTSCCSGIVRFLEIGKTKQEPKLKSLARMFVVVQCQKLSDASPSDPLPLTEASTQEAG